MRHFGVRQLVGALLFLPNFTKAVTSHRTPKMNVLTEN